MRGCGLSQCVQNTTDPGHVSVIFTQSLPSEVKTQTLQQLKHLQVLIGHITRYRYISS